MDFIRKTCAAIFIAILAVLAYAADFSANSKLSYLGQQIVPTGATFNGTTIGGLSSLDYSNSTAQYFAISDNRSNINSVRKCLLCCANQEVLRTRCFFDSQNPQMRLISLTSTQRTPSTPLPFR